MPIEIGLDPTVVGVVFAMAFATYATKAGGLWALGRVEVSDRTESALDVLPGAVLVSLVGPELVGPGASVAEWAAAFVVVVVAWRTNNVLFALVCGLVAVVGLRSVV